MDIGILQTGAPPEAMRGRFGDYADMIERMLGAGHAYRRFDVVAAPPPSPDTCAAFVITGSAAGVYDGAPWIAAMEDFLRAARGRAALVGICFGHQLMAQAFGGAVEKFAGGWGVGLNTYQVSQRAPWMDAAGAIALPASHQDQVVAVPAAARVLAANGFTRYAMLDYPGERAMSLQAHPEFDPDYARALLEARRGLRIPEDQADAAIASLAAPNDNARAARWINAFLARAD